MPLDYYYLGDVKNVEAQTCLDTMGRRTGENVGISYCHGLGGNQVRISTIVSEAGTIREIKAHAKIRPVEGNVDKTCSS